MDGEATIELVSGEVVGFDISGFSRFAETVLKREHGGSVDDLARVWERAAAPQIDRLIAAGYRIADICGDGVAAFRAAPLNDAAAADLLAALEHDFALAAPDLSLRTARIHGDFALISTAALGTTYNWASGRAIEALHGELSRKQRAAARSATFEGLTADPHDDALAFHWSRRRAAIRWVASLFVRLSPEPWMWSDPARISHAVERVAACAAAGDGRLEKLTHDDKGLLFRCAFTSQDDPLAAAARAAQLVQEAGLGVGFGAAVCEGRTYQGPLRVGAGLHVTMHGPSVNRAAKACARVEGLVVLAQPDEARRARLRALGLEPHADGESWSSPTQHAPAGTSPHPEQEVFIGRDAQLTRLRDLLATADGACKVLVIEAEAGRGKTALVGRFTAGLPPNWRLAVAQAAPIDGLRGPWPRLIRRMVTETFHDDSAALAGDLAAEGLGGADLGLLHHLGIDAFPPTGEDLEPLALRERLDRVFAAVVRACAGPIVLVVEDAHWLTPEAERWLELCRQVEGGRLLLVTRREGQGSALAGLADVERISLPVMTASETHALIRRLRPDLVSQTRTRSAIALLGRGSPLSLEQLARAWPGPDSPEFEQFEQQLSAGVDEGGEGGSVLARVLDVRLERLEPDETEVLRRLAIESRPRRIEDLEPAALSQAELAKVARRLGRLGLVHADRAGRLAPRHALIGEAVREHTPSLLLRRLHAEAARRLGQGERVEPAMIGAHWRAAREFPRAAVWMSRAAEAAEASGALRGAVDLYEQALDACPDAARQHRLALTWRSRLAAAAFGIGELSRARDEAVRCTTPHRHAAARRRALLVQIEIATFTADVGTAVRSLAELRRLGGAGGAGLRGREAALWAYALALGRALPIAHAVLDRAGVVSPRDRYYTQASRGLIHTCFAQWPAAEAALDEARDLSPPDRLPHENEIATTLLALGYYLRGRAGESLKLFEGIEGSGRRRDNAMHEAWGLYGGAQALIALDELSEAERRLTRAEALLRGHIDRQSLLICSGLRVRLADRRGDLDALVAAMDVNRDVAATMPASNFGSFEGYAARPTAALRRLAQGETSQALRAHARDGVRALGRYALLFPLGRPRLRTCLALDAAVRGRAGAARAELARARKLARRLQLPPETALANELQTLTQVTP